MNTLTSIADRTEAAEYYYTYIDKVAPGDIRAILRAQQAETVSFLENITDNQSLHRYEPGKWSIRDIVGHLNDTERVFVFRALWFARSFDTPLPSYDQDVAVPAAEADKRAWRDHIEEFRAVRGATISFFDSLPDAAWARRGTASGYEFTVRALAYIAAGHVYHHAAVVRARYLERDS